ncbi:hypothetical protein M5689_015640 [Euphorbia peplus]|nr:hypothetical protein M5689_015640 [Euphorbia peplus]
MSSAIHVQDSSEQEEPARGVLILDFEEDGEGEEEDELFEIDFEAISSIPPPHYWESYFTATTSTLLANCLLPIADVSCAIPTPRSTVCNSFSLSDIRVFSA